MVDFLIMLISVNILIGMFLGIYLVGYCEEKHTLKRKHLFFAILFPFSIILIIGVKLLNSLSDLGKLLLTLMVIGILTCKEKLDEKEKENKLLIWFNKDIPFSNKRNKKEV